MAAPSTLPTMQQDLNQHRRSKTLITQNLVHRWELTRLLKFITAKYTRFAQIDRDRLKSIQYSKQYCYSFSVGIHVFHIR